MLQSKSTVFILGWIPNVFGNPDTEHNTAGTRNPHKSRFTRHPGKGVHQTPKVGTPDYKKTGTKDPQTAGRRPNVLCTNLTSMCV